MIDSKQLVSELFDLAGLQADMEQLTLTGQDPLLPTSFHVAALAQSSIAAAGLAAAQVGALRGANPIAVEVDMHAAERECSGLFQIDGVTPESWAPLSGLYPCKDGFVRIHANFDHHRDGALALLDLDYSESVTRDTVTNALATHEAVAFETKAAKYGVPVYALRSFDEWDKTPQSRWLASEPLFTMTKITITKLDACAPASLPPLSISAPDALPLSGLRVLDLTRILAGPTCGRALGHYGADVMLVNSPTLPNIDHIADTSRGKRSVHLDLKQPADASVLKRLVKDAHIFVQGYRPGGLSSLGFDPTQLAILRPGIISVSLSAFGRGGEWSDRRGFDSLVQTATGFNHAEAEAALSDSPKALPVQILDYASGFIMAFAASAALLRQHQEGGSWHIEVSLAQTARWLRSLGRLDGNFAKRTVDLAAALKTESSGFGELSVMPHAANFNGQTLKSTLPSMPPGSHEPEWYSPERDVDSLERDVDSPERDVDSPERDVHSPERDVDSPERDVDSPERGVNSPERDVHSPERDVDSPERDVDSPERGVNSPERDVDSPERKK